eukprot:126819_1
MLPYLHKYITSSPPTPKHRKHSHRSSKHKHKRKTSHPKPSITSSCDTFESQYNDQQPQNEQKYESDLPSTSESKLILIETNNNDSDFFKSILTNITKNKNHKSNRYKSSKTKHIQYWTISIVSKHNNISILKSSQITMGFAIYDTTNDTYNNYDQILNNTNYGYEYCITYCDKQYYQSYHTKLKSLDDILISFNTKSNNLTLWQNGKRFNQIFQLYPNKIYAFCIKLYGNNYNFKILPNTGN